MTERTSFTVDEAKHVGERIGIDWDSARFERNRQRSRSDREDRPRTLERVSGLLHASWTYGGRGEARSLGRSLTLQSSKVEAGARASLRNAGACQHYGAGRLDGLT